MNEKQAWIFLAETWTKAHFGDADATIKRGNAFVQIGGFFSSNLHSSITYLYQSDLIEYQLIAIMKAKIKNVALEGENQEWSRTLDGAKERVAFCKKMVNEGD